MITSKYDRQYICSVLSRTEYTTRKFDNLSSEWLAHNLVYYAFSNLTGAKYADLDYVSDYRWYIVVGTKILELLGLE